MGAWAIGPFENDDAADWASELDDAEPAERPSAIRAALSEAADEPDYLKVAIAEVAVAAAAVVAAAQPAGPQFETGFAPVFLSDGEVTAFPDDLVALALRALDRVVADESEWSELWEQSGDLDAALGALAPIREALGG
ncbi:MAG TPA: DUF4259 domain-containing protein [Pseudonocardiaceae bacterium]|jgi:hypothetical protein